MSFLFRRRKIGTAISIRPAKFQLESGKELKLVATISPPGTPAEQLEWRLDGPGQLSDVKGASTTYKAPVVESETKVVITVSFNGYKNLLPSTASVEGTVLPPGKAAKTPTSLTVTPPSFSLTSEEEINLSASLKDLLWDEEIRDRPVKWSFEPSNLGSLSSLEGLSTVYRAPKVDKEVSVSVKAVFEGDEKFMPSEGISVGIVYPRVMYDEYIVSFSKAELEDLAVEGPVEVDGVKALKITASGGLFEGLSISRINFASKNLTTGEVEMYATKLMASLPEAGEKLEFDATKPVKYSSPKPLALKDVSAFVLRATFKEASIQNMGVTGRYIGGEEPYLPINIVASNIEVRKGYSVLGPETYGALVNKVTKMRMGLVEAKAFTIKLPLDYKLDRVRNKREFSEKWIAELKDVVAENVEMTTIYTRFRALRILRITFTGEEYTPSAIPHGYHRGEQGPVNDADVDAIYASIDKMRIKEVSLHIKR